MAVPSRPSRISDLAGQSLGQYQITQLIGRGGMAVVYKALQSSLHRYVAVKVLPPYLMQEEEFRTRFQREAETVARLDHPNILPVYDYGQQDDLAYIVMPLVTGGTLGDWLATGPPLGEVIPVLSQTLSALQHAHTREPPIVHRDIKPNNILMGERHRPLLTDFGIAKILEPSLQATRTGTIIGTPEYMAPEQSQGGAVDARTDLYAMGVILFQALTGQLPFSGQSPVMVLLQHVQGEVPAPRDLNPTLSSAWDEVIRRSLAKDPADRYPSAEAMDEAIQAAWHQAQREAITAQAATPTPALLTQQAAQLVRHGDGALAAERYTDARRYFEEALRVAPGLEEAQSGLSRVQRAQTLAGLYHTAQADIAAERWDAAAIQLGRILRQQPDYKDAAALLEMVTAQQAQAGPAPPPAAPPPMAPTPGPAAARPGPPVPPTRVPPSNAPAMPPPASAAGRTTTPGGQSAGAPGGPAAPTPTVTGGMRPPPGIAPTAVPGAAPAGSAPPAPPRAVRPPDAATVTPRAPAAPAASPPVVGPPLADEERPGRKRLWTIGLVALLVVAAVLGLRWLAGGGGPRPGPAPTATAVAVSATATAAPSATPTPSAADLFPACETAVSAADWAEASTACEKARDQDAAYPGLASALATTYVGLGKDKLAAGGPAAEALAYFEQAVAAQPDDAAAEEQRARAAAYLDGEAALDAGDWPQAASKLGSVYGDAPDYLAQSADGGVKAKLYAARVSWGQALLDAGSFTEALRRCEQALEVVPEGADALACQAAAKAALATPTPRPQPTAPPAPPPAAAPRAPAAAPAQPPAAAPAPAPRAPVAPAPAAPVAPAPALPPPPTRPGLVPPPTRAP
ncbi:MAG TPA: protein kinase [Chloroflexota bacterium]|nr:protein kinase [Chloroflexota bacterium]